MSDADHRCVSDGSACKSRSIAFVDGAGFPLLPNFVFVGLRRKNEGMTATTVQLSSAPRSTIRCVALDPNWFYSTLAQSNAAIVGLAGGFLVQRVVAQRGDLGGERLDLRRNLEAVQARIDQQRPAIVQMLNSMSEQLEVVAYAKNSGDSEVVLQRGLFATFTHSRGYPSDGEERQLVDIAERLITDARDAAAALLDVFPTHADDLIKTMEKRGGLDHKTYGWLRDPPGEFPVEGIDRDNVWRWMPFQRAKAQETFREQDRALEALAGQLHRRKAKLLPGSFYVLLGILASLLVAGVIAPMFFLTARDDASRPVLMVLFVPLALLFVGYLAFELLRLRQAGDLTRDS